MENLDKMGVPVSKQKTNKEIQEGINEHKSLKPKNSVTEDLSNYLSVSKEVIEETIGNGEDEIGRDVLENKEKFKKAIELIEPKAEEIIHEIINNPEKVKHFGRGMHFFEIDGIRCRLTVSSENTLSLGINTDAFVEDNPEKGTGHDNTSLNFFKIHITDEEVGKIVEAIENDTSPWGFKLDDESTHDKDPRSVNYSAQQEAIGVIEKLRGE